MKRMHHGGFSLVELMIAILLAAITGVVVLNVLTSYQSRSNTTTGRNDAEISVATSLYALEKDVRMAGAGLTTPAGPFCPLGVNIAWDGVAVSNGGPLMPVRIIDGAGGAPDQIEIIRSDSDFGAAPTRLVTTMAGPASQIEVSGMAGLRNGDLVMAGPNDGSRLCTLMQLTSAPAVNGSGWRLAHTAGTGNYNPADPAATFTTAVSYQVRDLIMNLGTYGMRRYGLVCSGGGAPSASNICDLASWNPLQFGATPALANVASISSQIVELQAQYGVSATPADEAVVAWVDADAAPWLAPADSNTVRRIKAIRISVVARGNREATEVAPVSTELWRDDPDDPDTARVRNFSAGEQRFRYRTLTVVVPLINSIWGAGS